MLSWHLAAQVGLIQQGLDEEARREAYLADITYVTNSELGFGALPCLLVLPAGSVCCRAGAYVTLWRRR